MAYLGLSPANVPEANTISSSLIADNTIVTSDISDGAVTTVKVADSAITTAKIAANAVVTVDIADGNVITSKIADNAITTAKIADGNVITSKIADNAITTSKIADGNVTTAKIADNAITTSKIADGNVITAKIADGNVITSKIADNAITTSKIADGNVTSIKMSTTGVAASTYGGTSNIPRIVIDSAGRITNAANVSLDTINGDLNVTGNVSITNKLTAIGTSGIAGLKIADVLETANATATAATGNVNFDVTTQAVLYYTTNASGNWTVNLRGSSGTSLNNLMANGESLTAVFLATQGSTAYYNSAVQIDGTGVTPKWQGGAAPTAGNANSVDVYSYTVFKTNNATYTVFASQTRFA